MYLILSGKHDNIVDGVAVEPTMDGPMVVWPGNRIKGSYVQVADGTWDASMGYRKTWDGSVVGDMPALPEADIWEGKAAIPPDDFVPLVAQAITPLRWARLSKDDAAKWVFDTINAPSMTSINPNDEKSNFKNMLAYLLATNGSDGAKLLTSAEVTAINGAWPI